MAVMGVRGIRIAERAKITQEFRDAVVTLCVERLKQIRQDMAAKDGIQLSLFKKSMGPTIVRLGKLAKDPASGMDMILTRLRGLPYTTFEVMSYNSANPDVQFLVGTTKDVEIRYGATIYNMGPYSVRIPFSNIVGTYNRKAPRLPGESWHFIPLKADERQHGDYRHPHHYGKWPTSAQTCWGDFNPLIFSLTQAADIPELFRTIYIYLTRYDAHSVLHGHVENGYFPWAVARRAGENK